MTDFENGERHVQVGRLIHPEPLTVTGPGEILKFLPLLLDLCVRCGQDGWDDLKYFFDLPDARDKRPQLLLLTNRAGISLESLRAADLVAAVLVQEYTLKGLRTGIYLTFGERRNVLAPPEVRDEAVLLASRALFRMGATLVFISYSDTALGFTPGSVSSDHALRFKIQRREIFLYLRLLRTLDETMATLGKRTRSHMRYYRRRAERELGCKFVPSVSISLADFLRFNRACAFAASEDLADIRYRALSNSPHSFLSGIRAEDGRWLSMVGGYKTPESIEIYWQMNLADLPDYSLSTVMRSFLIEDEISNGRNRLLIEGGTPHPMHMYFVRDHITDLMVMRNSMYGELLQLGARSGMPKKNPITQLLNDPETHWQSW